MRSEFFCWGGLMRRKTFRYRLCPTAAQERALLSTLDECRWLYNRLLEERRDVHKESGNGISSYSQINRLPELKSSRRSLKNVHSQVLQNVVARVDPHSRHSFAVAKRGQLQAILALEVRGATIHSPILKVVST
jgi:putative transposase